MTKAGPNAQTETTIEKLQEYKDKVKCEGEELIINTFPTRVLQLNQLLETQQFTAEDLSSVYQELKIPQAENDDTENPAKKRKLDDGTAAVQPEVTEVSLQPEPSNESVCQIIQTVKPYNQELTQHCNLLRMWVTFQIPKIEDGNNFGVEIQELIKLILTAAEYHLQMFDSRVFEYYDVRGEYVSKVATFPYIDDYRQAIVELDESMYIDVRSTLFTIRNDYSSLYDIIIKNIDKIKNPKDGHGLNLVS